MSDSLKSLSSAGTKKSLLQVQTRLLRYCGKARSTLGALKLKPKTALKKKGPDCACIGKSAGPDCECIGAKPGAKPVSFVQLAADPAPEDALAKEMTHDLEMNFNKTRRSARRTRRRS